MCFCIRYVYTYVLLYRVYRLQTVFTFANVQGEVVVQQLLVAVASEEQGPNLLVLVGLLLVN